MRKISYRSNKLRKKILKGMFIALIVLCAMAYHQSEMNKLKNNYEGKISNLITLNNQYKDDYFTYKVMYETVNKDINQYKSERDYAVKQYNYINDQIKYSKLMDKKTASRGDYEVHNLNLYPIITIDEMNKFIKAVAPSDSPFIGRGEDFLKISQLNGVDPRYYFAHACVETGYGKSDIAKKKGNYFGINAVNSNPNKAYDMGDDMSEGLENGAGWIRANYIDRGYNTLDKMIYSGGYAVYNNGKPNTGWITQISNIADKYYDINN
jgi:beta-N-acetylglucosaminidase